MWEEPWPQADPAQLERETFELVVQVNGKVRDKFEVPRTLSKPELIERALSSTRVQAYLDGKRIQQTIPVPGKLVNIVTAD
jgi:leucyl-tRNA synthetase